MQRSNKLIRAESHWLDEAPTPKSRAEVNCAKGSEVQLEVEDWNSTTEIVHSIVRVKLDVPSAHEGVDSRAQRTLVLRAAQYFADMWLSVVSFAEGLCYSTHIFKIEDSAGCVRELGPRLKFGPRAGDLRFRDAKNVASLVAALCANKK